MVVTNEQKQKAIDMLGQNLTVTAISKGLGVSRPFLYKLKKELLARAISRQDSDSDQTVGETLGDSDSTRSENPSESEESVRETDIETDSGSDSASVSGSDSDSFVSENRQVIFQKQSSINSNPIVQRFIREGASKPSVKNVRERRVASFPQDRLASIPQTRVASIPQENDHVMDGEKKEALITKISAYMEAFPQKLAPLFGNKPPSVFQKNLRQCSLARLDEYHGQIKYRVSNAGLSDAGLLAFQTASRGVESIGGYCGLNLQGYSQSLAQNEGAQQALKELQIEYLSTVAVTPQRRLAMICIMQAYNVHTSNTLTNTQTDFLSKEVNPDEFKV